LSAKPKLILLDRKQQQFDTFNNPDHLPVSPLPAFMTIEDVDAIGTPVRLWVNRRGQLVTEIAVRRETFRHPDSDVIDLPKDLETMQVFEEYLTGLYNLEALRPTGRQRIHLPYLGFEKALTPELTELPRLRVEVDAHGHVVVPLWSRGKFRWSKTALQNKAPKRAFELAMVAAKDAAMWIQPLWDRAQKQTGTSFTSRYQPLPKPVVPRDVLVMPNVFKYSPPRQGTFLKPTSPEERHLCPKKKK